VNDDAAFFAGGNSGSMTEDDSTTIGDISVNDLDGGESHTAAGGGTTALGSSWSIDAAGHWSYALNNAAVQNLNVNGSTTDSFIVSSFDGTASETVTITIAGLNDPATVTGNTSGTVTEAGAGNAGGTPTATGTLHDTDVDNNPNSFQAASGATTYGSFSILQNGKWTYTLDNTNAAFDGLITGQTLPDSFTVQTQDGTVQVVNITINGATDDLGGPTGIAFTMNAGANNANNLGTFTEIGDPDNTNDVYTGSVGSGSSVGFNVSGGTLNAGGVTVGANSILNLVLTDQAGHTATATYHVWIGGNGADNFSFAALGDNGSNIGDGMGNSDIITGGSGTDYLLGDNGGDTLIGGGAADFLAGGGGADTFKFTAVSDSTPASYDTVLDFNATGGQHDFIAFQNSLGLTTFDGQLGGATIAAGHVGWKVVGSETVVYANTSGATENLGSTNLEIHISGNGLGLTTADFLLHA
jgi:VCBS repeat-containing protein